MKTRKGLLSMIAALTMSACAVGPDYQRPEIQMPQEFHQVEAVRNGAKPADLGKWWTSFNDRELDSLIERAV